MKKFMNEFKEFALRGNVIDLAIGVLIGGAFQGLVGSFTENIINPLIGMFGGMDLSKYAITIGEAQIKYGAFITAIINFIIMALVVFFMLKAINKLAASGKKEEASSAPATKICNFCKTEIAIDALRCPHCTSELTNEK